jgi:hypothetical protein
MKKRRSPRKPVPLVMAEIGMASAEVIARRTRMMLTGACSPAEYHRMVAEKVAAAQSAGFALLHGRGPRAMLNPFHSRVTSNVRRLRKKK